jgi:hypothetical protein
MQIDTQSAWRLPISMPMAWKKSTFTTPTLTRESLQTQIFCSIGGQWIG